MNDRHGETQSTNAASPDVRLREQLARSDRQQRNAQRGGTSEIRAQLRPCGDVRNSEPIAVLCAWTESIIRCRSSLGSIWTVLMRAGETYSHGPTRPVDVEQRHVGRRWERRSECSGGSGAERRPGRVEDGKLATMGAIGVWTSETWYMTEASRRVKMYARVCRPDRSTSWHVRGTD